MKKSILFVFSVCLILTLSTKIYAQQKTEYKSVFGETNTSFNLFWAVCDAEGSDSLYFQKDTLINSTDYKKFKSRFPQQLFLRESEDHSKLYSLVCVYRDHECFLEKEILLMDLDLNLQDTFYFPIPDYYSLFLVVESIFYDNDNLKHIVFGKRGGFMCSYFDFIFEFIEGIGPTAFIFHETVNLLLCVYKDFENVYTNNSEFLPDYIRGKCFVPDVIGIKDILKPKNNLKIYPNPANSFIEIDLGEDFTSYQQLVVCDLLGRPCLNSAVTREKQYFDIQNLPVGIYIVKTIVQGKTPVYGKFAVMR